MAILQGFPPSNTISASVRIQEIDLSYIAPQQSFHQAGIVGFASKGPINIPTSISSTRQLATIFGNPHPDVGDPFLIYAAQQYLLVASQLWVVRVADVDPVSNEAASTATINVPIAGTLVQIESATAGPYTFTVDSFFSWRLNGVLSSKTLVVLGPGHSLPGGGTSTGVYSVSALVADLNEQLDAENDGIGFYVTHNNTIGVETLWAYGPNASLELVSIQNQFYGNTVINGNPTGLGTGMTAASCIGSYAMYPNVAYETPGDYDFVGLTGLNLQIVIDGTDNVLIDGVVQVIDLSGLEGGTYTISQVVTAINAELSSNGGTLPGGWLAKAVGNNLSFTTLTYGEDARLLIKADSTAAGIFGLPTTTNVGTSPSGVTGAIGISTFGIVTGAAGNGATSFIINADSPGIDGNSTQVVIATNTQSSTFVMNIYNNGVSVENWGNLTKDTTSSYYIQTYISLVSNYISVVDNTSEGAGPLDGTYSLVGGNDGIPSDPDNQDALLVGSLTGYTGLYTLSDTEQINIDIIAIPGHSSTQVVLALLSFCQNTRQDCLAIVDPPFGLTVQEIIDWQNGTHPLNLVQFNSDFGALYWPWVMIQDTFNLVNVWVPPSGSVMAVIANNDNLAEPWYAPAGTTRGIVPGILDVYSRPTLSDRDAMYGNGNCINPIVQFSDISGFLVWGQKTLQRLPTALDRVNVRRLMFYIEKTIKAATRILIFEPNDSTLQTRFRTLCTGILDTVQTGQGIYAYIIVDDDTVNTPDTIARNEFHAQIGIQPTYAAEFFFIEFSINLPGSFTEPA